MFLQPMLARVSAWIQIVRMYWVVVSVYIAFYARATGLLPVPERAPDTVRIKRVYLIRDPPESDFADITDWFIPHAKFHEDIAEAFPHWGRDWRVEIRYAVNGTKFRDVYRCGDSLHWPPELHSPPVRGPRGIVSAVLHSTNPGNVRDITQRVKKYAGPNGDFGLRAMPVHHLFPMEDPPDLDESYSSLTVVRLHPPGPSVSTTSHAVPDGILSAP